MEKYKVEQHENFLPNKETNSCGKEDSFIVSLLRSCCVIPQRYIFAIVGLIGVCNAFTMRATLNMAITQMVKHRHIGREHLDTDACPSDKILYNATVVTNPGPTMPALAYMMARWIPPHQRAFLSAIIFGGGQIGNIFGSIISGILLANGRDWAYVFYFFGSFGIFWFILWSLLCYSEPNTHPFISKKELEYLNRTITRAKDSNKKDSVPWKAIIRSPPAWALLVANVGHDWGLYTIVSDLPKYTHDVLKFNIATTGILTGLPFMAMTICASIFGIICDFCIRKKWHSAKTARKLYTTIAATGPAICIILASYSGCNRNAAMIYFIISMGLMGAYYSGMKVNTLDLAPNYAGSLTSFINTASTFAGIITPYLTGLLTPDSTLIQWRTAFWVCFAMLVGTNIIYCIWMEGEQIWWDDVRQYGYPPGWKHGPIIKDEVKNNQDVELIEKISKDLF